MDDNQYWETHYCTVLSTGFARELLQETGRQGSCLCALCASRGVLHLLPKSWHYTTQHNYQLDIKDSNVLGALETLPVLRGCDYTRTCTKGAITITVERDSRERLTSNLKGHLAKQTGVSEYKCETVIGNSAIRLA